MKGRLFAFVPAIVIVTVFAIVYALAYFRIQQNLTSIRQSELTTVVNSAGAKIKSKKDALRLLGQELENDKTLGRTYLAGLKSLGSELHSLESKYRIDIADIVDDTNGKAVRFKELSSAKIITGYKKFTRGFLVSDVAGKLTLLSFGPLNVEGVPQGILILGYHLNETLAAEISRDTNSSARFVTAGESSTQLIVETYGGSSVSLGLVIDGQYSSGLNRSTLLTIAFLGLVALVLIGVLIYVYTKRIRAQAIRESFANFVEGVVHDLKSSLRALNNSVHAKDFGSILNASTEIHQILGLVKEKKKDLVEEEEKNEPMEPQMLAVICNEALSRARMQYRDRPEIAFECEFNSDSHAVFAKVQRNRLLRRVLPNIIVNAVESISGEGVVAVRVDREGDHAVIRVIDNGCGIPADILPKICSREFTFGKSGGSGFGLWQVSSAVSSWGGAVDFDSKRPGTVVHIRLPLVKAPSWLVSKLEVGEDEKIVILDDDPSVHAAWRRRLEGRFGGSYLGNVFCFENAADLARSGLPDKRFLFLCDYHLGEETGIDVVRKLGLKTQAIVVSHLDDEIVKACSEAGLNLLPKELIGAISITLKPKVRRSSA